MKLTAYLCTSDVCSMVSGYARDFCKRHEVELSEQKSEQLSAPHALLLEAAGWNGRFPAFVAEDGPHARAFGAEGWCAFERDVAGRR